MVPFLFRKGMPFNEMICKDRAHMDRLIVFLCRYQLDPFKAAQRINASLGDTLCEVHNGTLDEYEDVGQPKSIMVNGVYKFAKVEIVVVRVKYADGYEGYTYRTEITIETNK